MTTEKQREFAMRLYTELQTLAPKLSAEDAEIMAQTVADNKTLLGNVLQGEGTSYEASKVIDVLLSLVKDSKERTGTVEYRWTKAGTGEWVVVGPGLEPGKTVTVVSSKGKQEITIERVSGEYGYPARENLGEETGLDLNPLFEGLKTTKGDPRTSVWVAVPGGDSRLKLRIDRPDTGRHAGRIFVKDAAVYGSGQMYGRQEIGATYVGKCGEELKAILADRKAAMEEYGRLVGQCGVCNRPLEDPTSVALGIGPYCLSQL